MNVSNLILRWRAKIVALLLVVMQSEQIATADKGVPEPPLGFPSAAAADERLSIVNKTKAILHSLSHVDFKVYGRSGDESNWIVVYQIRDLELSRKCVQLLAEEKKSKGWRKIFIKFMEDEVWITRGKGDAKRGEERLLRSFLIE